MDEKIDLDEVRALVKIASEADITELSVESPALKVSIKKAPGGRLEVQAVGRAATARPAPAGAAAGGPVLATPEEMAAAGAEVVPDHLRTIAAPMVGTFYRALSPDAAPFVQEGDAIEAGQTVCIIEAMKLFNEIQSDVSGRIVSILSDNGNPVEYGQPLILIEPAS